MYSPLIPPRCAPDHLLVELIFLFSVPFPKKVDGGNRKVQGGLCFPWYTIVHNPPLLMGERAFAKKPNKGVEENAHRNG